SITAAIAHAREVGSLLLLLGVEVRKKDGATMSSRPAPTVIILENIESNKLAFIAQRLRERWTGEGRKFLLEMSGGITRASAPSHRR
ncbi:hypothetical protein BJV74DRAFT_769424, partial [Russula compacta]